MNLEMIDICLRIMYMAKPEPSKNSANFKNAHLVCAVLEHGTSNRTEFVIEFFQEFQGVGIGNTRSLGKQIWIKDYFPKNTLLGKLKWLHNKSLQTNKNLESQSLGGNGRWKHLISFSWKDYIYIYYILHI